MASVIPEGGLHTGWQMRIASQCRRHRPTGTEGVGQRDRWMSLDQRRDLDARHRGDYHLADN